MERTTKWTLFFLLLVIVSISVFLVRITWHTSDEIKTAYFNPPITFIPSSENKGLPCQAVYYGQGNGDGIHDPSCFDLQAKLSLAASGGDIEKMVALLRAGANADASAGDYVPPLYAAALSGQNEAVRLLLDNGANINRIYTLNGTPLFATIYGNHPQTAALLIARGANVNIPIGTETALQIAQEDQKQEIVALLKKAGAH